MEMRIEKMANEGEQRLVISVGARYMKPEPQGTQSNWWDLGDDALHAYLETPPNRKPLSTSHQCSKVHYSITASILVSPNVQSLDGCLVTHP
jgi:hypothetical protein